MRNLSYKRRCAELEAYIQRLEGRNSMLERINLLGSNRYAIAYSTTKELPGTDCPADECGLCHGLFEVEAPYCSKCGARIVRRVER